MGGVGAYTWAPDGRTVAFLSQGPADKARKKREKRGFDAEIYEEDRRPTRAWIVDVTVEGAKPRALELEGGEVLQVLVRGAGSLVSHRIDRRRSHSRTLCGTPPPVVAAGARGLLPAPPRGRFCLFG